MTIANPPLMRSRFALSQKAANDLDRLGDAFDHYPSLRGNLGEAGITPDPSLRLLPGPQIAERVFTGPEIDFGSGIRLRSR